MLCKIQQYERVAEKYAMVESILQTSMEHGNAVKNAQKLQQDFYFSAFHPVEHYTLEVTEYSFTVVQSSIMCLGIKITCIHVKFIAAFF